MLSFWKKLAFLSLSMVSAMLYYMVYMIIPQFSETFSTFGNKLPLVTHTFFSIRQAYLWLFATTLVLIAAWAFAFIVRPRHKLIKSITLYNFVAAMALLVFMLIAMYLPIFSLGDAIL